MSKGYSYFIKAKKKTRFLVLVKCMQFLFFDPIYIKINVKYICVNCVGINTWRNIEAITSIEQVSRVKRIAATWRYRQFVESPETPRCWS